jgi:hypothetical protein
MEMGMVGLGRGGVGLTGFARLPEGGRSPLHSKAWGDV